MAEPAPPIARVASYRLQLTTEHGFAAAAAAVPDLAALGISHLYLSPVAEAVPGSTHGYDVVDPTRLRQEVGGEDGFGRLVDACRAAGLGLLVDIVPNHLAAHEHNPWWWDVLRLGRASRHADLFDIDWTATDTVLVPVLADHYGRELEAGRIRLERGTGPGRVLVVRYGDRRFPVRPEAEGAILAEVARHAHDDVLGVAARVLARSERPDVQVHERDADLAVAERTVRERLATGSVAGHLDAELGAINADADRLDLVLTRQHHRLARWVVGDAELEYRRFFDVDTLVATRMDRPGTFDLLHRLPLELVRAGAVDGLRIDHVDGIADPAAYLARLRTEVGDDTWLVVEKILRPDEELPPWPVAGTTGYEVADLLGGWLTDPAGADAVHAAWSAWTGEGRSFEEVALEARREVLAAGFATDVERVVDALAAVCDGRRRHRDHTRAALRAVVTELAVHTPTYRTYVTPDPAGGGASPRDLAELAATAKAARAADPALDPELVDLVVGVLGGAVTGEAEAAVVTRFQQLTGPVAAKGEEDTALYRWQPLPHRCEVGADPASPSVTAAAWHEACALAQERWPQRLTTLSTHDTKRSADARARLAALTLDPAALVTDLDRWWAAVGAGHDGAVDRATGWSVFHTLVAGWPMEVDRAWTVVEKSAREAGVRTSWTRPDEAFEAALRSLVEAAVEDVGPRAVVLDVVQRVAAPADEGALAQLLAQLLAPGVPDVYQGGEAWDLSLVDPDNRRPVDADRRRALVADAATTEAAEAWGKPDLRRSGLPRTIVLRTALAARRRHPAAVGPGRAGAYLPLAVEGPDAGRVLAFGRGDPVALVAVVARPGWRAPDATVALPDGGWADACTGARHEGRAEVRSLLDAFPVALLER